MPPKPSRALILALAGVAVFAISLPAIGKDTPESLLPPGFGDAPPARPAAPSPAPAASPGAAAPVPLLPPDDLAASDDSVSSDAEAGDKEDKKEPVELPDQARRSIDLVGPLTPDTGGLGEAAFGRADGRFLTRLMRQLDAPLPSRWASILLRRALASRVPTPLMVGPADWIAERAWLLLRMGEADAARLLVASVDTDRFSPRLTVVAQQVALATSDPSALCPLTQNAANFSQDKNWDYARAICASLAGDGPTSTMFLDRARGRASRNTDHLLVEKVIGAGTNARRAAHIEWDDVDRLNSWRFGLASAVGLEIPERLLKNADPAILAWRARAPMYHPEDRIDSARIAARLGVFSSADLVDLYGQIGEREGDVGRDAPAARLRTAYVGDDANARMNAIRSFWTDGEAQPGGLYAAQILVARAAAGLRPDSAFSSDYARLIATMLTAGLDMQASRWASLVQQGSPSVADEPWALLAVGSPRRVVDLSYARVDRYGSRLSAEHAQKIQMLIAGLSGLGRLSSGDEARLTDRYALPLGRQTPWTKAIDRAAQRGEQGTVALLAAVGMQTGDWRSVPPLHLYHIVSALRRTGNEPAARMIAAEALSRL